MKQIIGLFVLLLTIMVFAAWATKPDNLNSLLGTKKAEVAPTLKPLEKKIIKIKDQEINAEIARSEPERSIGLSKYHNLDEKTGMLFVFEKKDIQPEFWMKDMNFSIDIIWINDGHIAQITPNVPPPAPGTKEDQLSRYSSQRPIDYVLELNANTTQKLGIRVGDTITLPSF